MVCSIHHQNSSSVPPFHANTGIPAAAIAAGNIPVFAVKGVNAEKPATTIYVITREPVVIYKKMPDVTGKGTRLAFPRGRNTGIRIAPGELLRVAQGEDLDLYYQGGKVWANPIESGTWMRFEAIEPPPPAPKPAPPATASAAPPSAPTAPAANQPAATPKAAGG